MNPRPLHIYMLGKFEMQCSDSYVSPKIWDRDRSLQLFQFLLCQDNRRFLHKEQIIDKLWFDLDLKNANQTFKTALHGLNKALKSLDSCFSDCILRHGSTYRLNMDLLWLDTLYFQECIKKAEYLITNDQGLALQCFEEAFALYQGPLLPNRLYNEWCSDERERLQLLYLNALTKAAELVLGINPSRTIILTGMTLMEDETWESAYRLQMKAYLELGNRPMAIKTYEKCKAVLLEQFGIEPLPATKKAFNELITTS